jgi:hypothetical protein
MIIVNAQIDSVKFEKNQSLLIDGGIQDIKKGSTDKSATGQLGYRGENIFGKFEIKFTAVSTASELKSANISDYSAMVINPYNSQSGLDAFNVSYFRRSFNKLGGFVNYLVFLYNKEEISSKDFDQIISDYALSKYKKWYYKLGYAVEGNVSNFTWVNTADMKKNGNIVAINPYLTINPRFKFLDDVVDIIVGCGPAMRIIAGDVRNDSDFLKSIFATDKTEYLGAQFTAQLYISGFYAKANYAIFGGETSIEGLTGGQFYVSVGLQANIGSKSNKNKSIEDIIRIDLPIKMMPDVQ